MEAPRGVEPTGTNGRKATLTFQPLAVGPHLPPANGTRRQRALSGHKTKHRHIRVRCPVPRPPQAGRPQRLTVQEKICGGHGPGETPGPIPNPEAKAWHGDGTAPDRVWESSTPPHHTYRKPLGAHAPRGFRIPETLTTQTHTPPQKHPGLLALMRPTPGTIPGQPRRRGRTTRRVRDRGSPTPGPPGPPRGRLPLKEGSQKPLGPRRDTPAGAQCVLGGNPLNTR